MQWTDQGIILSARKHGENSLILRIFAREHGLYAGLARVSRRALGHYQQGTQAQTTWKARLSEHLGSFICETTGSGLMMSAVFADSRKLAALVSACALVEVTLAERDPHPGLYDALQMFRESLGGDAGWPRHYARFELALLRELGFGLDLARCAATGSVEDLIYVSPKSGRAVSRAAGEPWKVKLLPLPAFLRNETGGEVADGLALTGFFLHKYLFSDGAHREPPARERFISLLTAVAA